MNHIFVMDLNIITKIMDANQVSVNQLMEAHQVSVNKLMEANQVIVNQLMAKADDWMIRAVRAEATLEAERAHANTIIKIIFFRFNN